MLDISLLKMQMKKKNPKTSGLKTTLIVWLHVNEEYMLFISDILKRDNCTLLFCKFETHADKKKRGGASIQLFLKTFIPFSFSCE